jgi:L-ascorbate metabolism protein UlaG (beta-lactamase superfamily)
VKGHRPDILFTVINPFGNLDPGQAAQLAKELGVKQVIPCHHDLFPDNCLPPRLLHTNLAALGLGRIYRELARGKFSIFGRR